MRLRGLRGVGAVLLALVAAGGCDDGEGAGPARGGGPESVFRLVDRIVLEEDPDDPIVGVTALEILDDGDLLIVDEAGSRVWRFGPDGGREGVLGRPGQGPGELENPTAVAQGPGGTLYVVQRASPRVTVFGPEGGVELFDLPGQYGHWIREADGRLVVGLGALGDRFAVLTPEGDPVATFAPRDPALMADPLWLYLVRERATLAGSEVVVNSSFEPGLRVFDLDGRPLRTFGEPPSSWRAATVAEEGFEGPEGQRRMEEWLRSFTVVTGLAAVDDSLIVVQYGGYDPVPNEMRRLEPRSVDVYHADGRKLAEGVPFEQPVLRGGGRLYTLLEGPPGPWTLGVWEWRGDA